MYESLLTFFKYAGPVVATLSSIWAATHTISREVDGRRTLTPAGRVAIGLAIGGLVITLASSYLKDAVDRQKATDSAEAETKRVEAEKQQLKVLALSGQPLTRLSLTWRFEGVSASMRAAMIAGRDEADDAYREGVYNVPRSKSAIDVLYGYYALYPFLRTIASEFQGGHGRGPGESHDTVIALLALDAATNAVLPIGYLSHDSLRSDEWNRIVSEGAQFAGGVRLPEDKFTFIDDAPPKFTRRVVNAPTLSIDRGAATIEWDLDPATFLNAVDRQAGSIPVMATLPEALRVVLISEAARLPFQGTNLAAPRECSPWSSDAQAKPVTPSRFSASTMTLVPNGSAANPVRYRLGAAFLQSLRNDYNHPCDFTDLQLIFDAVR
jgi:hypothetical protein